MCLTTRFPFIKTKKPIFCYKVVEKDYTSQYQKFPYKLNKLYRLNNLTSEYGIVSVKSIFPKELWTTFEVAQYHFLYIGRGEELITSNFLHLKVIIHGFHAYRNLEYAISLAEIYDNIVVKCVIPEGSIIGINYDEIVSNQIIIIEQVKV